jgi:SAM-dependent methyltransferase
MSHVAPYSEPLRELAAEAYEISGRLCGACGDLHALWPYIRLSRASTGVEAQESKLQAELRGCFARGLRDVLIAGSQDAGLLALVAHAKMRAGAEHPSGITVLDICETPLELCRRLAGRWSLPIETIREDLAELSTARRFDLVLVHGTLHFMAADRRLEALRGIASALRPGGRLVLLFNTSRTVTADSDQTAGAGYGGSVLAELARLGVPLPATEAVMRERLDLHQRRRELREGAFAEPGEVEALLDAAGLDVIACTLIDVNIARPIDAFVAKISKRRFMALAEPKSTAASRA